MRAAGVDWSPIVLATAAILGAMAPGIAAVLLAVAARLKLAQIAVATDGNLAAANAKIVALQSRVDHLGGQLSDRPLAVPTVLVADRRVSGLAASGAAMPLSVPTWNQHDDPNPVGGQDPYWYEDCGEQCISMVAAACRGISVPQGVIRVQMHGAGGRGLSSPDDIEAQLRRMHFDAAHHTLSAPDALAYIGQAVASGRSTIVLGHWVAPTLLHWVVVVEATPDGVTFNDPWTGKQRGLSNVHWDALYAGSLVDPGEPVRY